MKRITFLMPILLLFVFCKKQPNKEYYPDGSLKNEFSLINGKYEGVFKKYYQSGQLEQLHTYSNGRKVDSSLFYNRNGVLDYIDYHNINDSIGVYRKYFYENESLKSEGFLHNEELMVGYWSHYNEDYGYLEEVREMINIDNKPYLNQNWHFNAKGDTIHEKSVYANLLFFKDTISITDAVKVYAVQEQPFFKDKNSSIMAVVPKDYSEDFDEYFSNLNEVEVDTTYNLNVDKEYRTAGGMPEGDYALEVVFGRYYNTPGPKMFRGILVEYSESNSKVTDTLGNRQHKIYFEKSIYVKDSVDLTAN